MRTLLSLLSITTVVLAVTAGCGRNTPEPAPPTEASEPGGPGGRPLAAPEPTPGIYFRLSDATDAGGAGGEAVPLAEVEALSEVELAAVLARLPELGEEAATRVDFAFPPGPRPPAIAGETRQEAFPPDAEVGGPPPDAESGPLTVLRFGPEGELDTVPRLSLTFSKPMVPLSSHGALAEAEVPVQIEPQPDGQWRWVGTRTLLFEPEGGRFPKATDYAVTVPAGIEAADGETLAEAASWRFQTSPPELLDFYPDGGPTERQPLIFAGFDQAIDPEAVLGSVQATAGRERVALRLATDAEIEADAELARRVEAWSSDLRADRWLVLRPDAQLPGGAEVRVTFAEGLPSAEGPRTTEEEQERRFQVHEALRVAEIFCESEDEGFVELSGSRRREMVGSCEPFSPWGIEFNNPLEPSSVDPEAVEIDPDLPGRRVMAGSSGIIITGASEGRTRYTVRLPAEIRDVFGQSLGEGYELRFETGDLRPALALPGDELIVLDPAAEGTLNAFSVNNTELEVALYRVGPEDWAAYQIARRSQRDEQPVDPPGEPVWQGRVEPEGDRDAVATARIDLSPALDAEGHGQVLAVVEPGRWSWEDESWSNRPEWRWIQVTDLGLDVASDAESVNARVTGLAEGAPTEGVDVELLLLPRIDWREGRTAAPAPVPAGTARTDAEGLATLAAPEGGSAEGDSMLVARAGDDLALLPYGVLGWGGGEAQLLWHVFDDRGLYKPGEQVHVKGWLRRLDMAEGGDLSAPGEGLEGVAWSLRAANGEEAGSGRFELTPLGGFSGLIALPEDIALGDTWLQLRALGAGLPAAGREQGHRFQVAEFRRPEFEVTTRLEEPTLIFGDQARVTARAEYYAGGALPGAETRWWVTAEPADYSPPGHEGFVFGRWRPWWGFWEPEGSAGGQQSHEGRTDALGEHHLAIDLEGAVPIGPARFQAQAEVMDVNRQAWSSASGFLVHPARDYVGLRVASWFVDPNEALEVEAIVADIDGALVSDRSIALTAERVEGRWQGERWLEEAVPAGDCALTSAEEPVACELRFDTGGQYRLTAEVADAEGRPNLSQLTIWVSGGAPRLPQGQGIELEEVQLVPEAEDYQPGDTARVLVQAPFAPAEGVWSLRRSGLLAQQAFQVDERGTATLEIPIEEGHVPNLWLQVELTGSAPRLGGDGQPDADLPARPAYASGSLELKVPPLSRSLEVEAAPLEPAIQPGGTTIVEVVVRDADGAPVPEAELALIVVDEAVLALTGHDIGDPLAAFYPERGAEVRDERLRRWLQLADPGALAGLGEVGAMGLPEPGMMPESAAAMDMMATAPMAMEMPADEAEEAMSGAAMMRSAAAPKLDGETLGYDGDDAAAAPIVERVDLNPLAAFLPDLRTDAEGRASAEITLPDSVTRYRIWAVATDGVARFGRGDSNLTARLPLILRPSAPRFLNFGDRFELPLVVQNQGEEDLEVQVVVRAENLRLARIYDDLAADPLDPEAAAPEAQAGRVAGLRATIPAGDRRELRFPAAAELPGQAALQAVVVSGDLADAQRVTLPVWTPATTEAFATYGEIDAGAIAQPVERPPALVEGFGGLELTTSSTALSALTDAFLYLDTYPFEHEEATASRLLASVALVDVLEAFGAEGIPDREAVEARIAGDIERLAARQSSDGGWGWWPHERRSSPFTAIHVMQALSRAAEKAYPVPEATLERGRDYLRVIDSHLQALELSRPARLGLRSYALYVRALTEPVDAEEARALLAERDALDLDAQAWLLTALAGAEGWDDERAALRRALANAVVEEAGTAQLTTGYEETESAMLLASDRRTDAVALEALMADQPDSDLIPKLVRGLLGHRKQGHWGSTQENAWVLLALDRYFRTYEAEEPDFTVRAWLGEDYVGQSRFAGRSPDRSLTEVPMAALPAGEPADLVLAKEGPGRLYYRLGLRYAPEELELEPLERGFAVERIYEAVDDPDDVRRTADGGWEVQAGARVRVRLTMVAPARRYHVALVDPLPAGLEALNPELATTGELPPDPEDEAPSFGDWPWWRWWRWYEHEAFRDASVEAFTSLLWDGVHSYTYVARATTPGDFVVPPAKAEELFQPETFGRSATDRLRVVVP